MTTLYDLMLPAPIPHALIRLMLFGVFYVHLTFVLLMLGTAILALAYFIDAWWGGRLGELRWDKKILRAFLAHKSLAVVFGVGPLLLIQVGFSIPFFTAVALFTPFWLLIIVFLIVSFLSFDALGHRIYTHRYLHLFFGILAMTALLCVPGFFVAVLVAAENSARWMDVLGTGFGFDWRISAHWFLRYLHVLGAGVVFGAAFHYFFTAPRFEPERQRTLLKWMLGGLLFQLLDGMLLYLSLLARPDAIAGGYLIAGVILALTVIWLTAVGMQPASGLQLTVFVPTLLALLAAMLLTRQQFQNRAFLGIIPDVVHNAAEYEQKLAPYHEPAVARYTRHMNIIYDNGPTIYTQSCAFCHGDDAKGQGPDAKYLKIPPADLTAIRSRKDSLMHILENGVDGTGMPQFTYYDIFQLNAVLDYLDKRFNVFSMPPPVTHPITSQEQQLAERIWSTMCATCHGQDGKPTKTAAAYKPPPPDFTQYGLMPSRAYTIITDGYAGTKMPASPELTQGTRWALTRIVLGFRKPGGGQTANNDRDGTVLDAAGLAETPSANRRQ